MGDATTIPIGWMVAIVVSAGSAVIFLFSTFKTKEAADSDKMDLQKHVDRVETGIHERLGRIEDKLDRVIEL